MTKSAKISVTECTPGAFIFGRKCMCYPDMIARTGTGTNSACNTPKQKPVHPLRRRPIRTLSVSLLAVAAIAASLLLSREKPERMTSDGIAPADRSQPAEESLDAIRAAGL